MLRAFSLGSLGLALAAAAAAGPRSAAELERVLLSQADLGRAWDVMREVPGDPSRDPDLVRWGVRAQLARHYTRHATGYIHVCSIEVWAFAGPDQARAAHDGFAYPDWQILREGSLLVMLRGLSQRRGGPPQRGVFPECKKLGARTQQRAARLARN